MSCLPIPTDKQQPARSWQWLDKAATQWMSSSRSSSCRDPHQASETLGWWTNSNRHSTRGYGRASTNYTPCPQPGQSGSRRHPSWTTRGGVSRPPKPEPHQPDQLYPPPMLALPACPTSMHSGPNPSHPQCQGRSCSGAVGIGEHLD